MKTVTVKTVVMWLIGWFRYKWGSWFPPAADDHVLTRRVFSGVLVGPNDLTLIAKAGLFFPEEFHWKYGPRYGSGIWWEFSTPTREEARKAVSVDIEKVIRPGSLAEIVRSIDGEHATVSRFCLSEEQIVEFVREYWRTRYMPKHVIHHFLFHADRVVFAVQIRIEYGVSSDGMGVAICWINAHDVEDYDCISVT